MAGSAPGRRDFLASSGRMLGGGWLALQLPALVTLAACARDAARRGEPLSTLSPAEGSAMASLAAQIFPPDDTPGAEDAGAVYFIDRALGGPFSGLAPGIREGLAALDARAREVDPTAGGFAALSWDDQTKLVREVEDTPFFNRARMLTVMGMFADPAYGGNREGIGARILGYEPHGAYQPPFGWYDAEHARTGGAG